MALLVLQAGAGATVQDRGRVGFRSFGVPDGGAFDRSSIDLANALLNNDPDAAALELTLVGGRFRALDTLAIALAGAPMTARIHSATGPDRVLSIPQTATLRPGDELQLGGCPTGARTYLASRGGWLTPVVMGSRSSEMRLKVGDVLPAHPGEVATLRPSEWPLNPIGRRVVRHGEIDECSPYSVGSAMRAGTGLLEKRSAQRTLQERAQAPGPIRVIDGPDAEPGESARLEVGTYRVEAQSDRMGLRLDGPLIDRVTDPDRASAPTAPGAVQLAGGRPIVLGVAGGTMGGYCQLAHVISADIDRIGQLRPGDGIEFRRVTIDEARTLDRLDRQERRRWLIRIRLGAGCLSTG